jgi:catechol-2,3-dioxygenase
MAINTPLTEKVISPVKLAHVVLRTSPEKFKEMSEFYKSFLGGQASYENDFFSFITYHDEHHRIAILAIPGTKAKDQQTSGLEVRPKTDLFPPVPRKLIRA